MPVVEKVNIKVKKGEVFGILGPNAGKTTLIKMLYTLILPTEGTTYVNEYDIAKDSRNVWRSIVFILLMGLIKVVAIWPIGKI